MKRINNATIYTACIVLLLLLLVMIVPLLFFSPPWHEDGYYHKDLSGVHLYIKFVDGKFSTFSFPLYAHTNTEYIQCVKTGDHWQPIKPNSSLIVHSNRKLLELQRRSGRLYTTNYYDKLVNPFVLWHIKIAEWLT